MTPRIGLQLLSLAIAVSGCSTDTSDASDTTTSGAQNPAPRAEAPAPPATSGAPAERQAFFGDLHIHSSWSVDGLGAGVRAGPEQAYQYAKGQAIDHVGGQKIQLAGPPLDFMALTDHAEYLGVTLAATKPTHPLRQQPLIRTWLGPDMHKAARAWKRIIGTFSSQEGLPALRADEVILPAWQALIELANRHDEPGRFSAFVGFEYTSNPQGQNLHRNVLFRGDDVPDRPFSAMDSQDPEDLWRWMDRVRAQGDDLLAIPHNSNGSNGQMFARTRLGGAAVDSEWAERRRANEPVAEVLQIKGQSETHPILSPDDEWADFEVTSWRTANPDLPSEPAGSYVRDALGRGLLLQESLGINPFELGMIGSTDGHNASSPFEERNFTGKIGRSDGTPEDRLRWKKKRDGTRTPGVVVKWSAAGLAGIWADANTRGDLFDALRRRETFATSGPRIRLRFFAGWNFTEHDAGTNLANRGYARGVPMGGRLEPSSEVGAVTFLLAAHKDPLEADLERLQIVKGWIEDGEAHERVFDVACADGSRPAPENHRCAHAAAPPDLSTCDPDPKGGASELRSWWRDPDFDPSERAFYYARVLQVPTCRWSTWDALRLDVPIHTAVPATIQERAMTSPIWVGSGPP